MRFPNEKLAIYETCEFCSSICADFSTTFGTASAFFKCQIPTLAIDHFGIKTMPFQLFILLSTTLISRILSPTYAQTTNTTTTDPSNTQVHCNPFKLFHFRPEYQDCNDTIEAFPLLRKSATAIAAANLTFSNFPSWKSVVPVKSK
jgi:hypothetical protein